LELNTIARVEQYLVDALVASPLIPLGVNILRLADAIENEGVVQNTNNIVVRYTGSTNNVKNRIPLIYERQMSFDLNFSTQNYLSSSGHDFATQLLAGSFITLNGGVPGGAGIQVIEPFSCQNEQFTGLSEESQYTYTQTWVITVEELLPYVALDPCVQRGDCSRIFPSGNVETVMPLAGVLNTETGEIWVPSYTGKKLPGEDYTGGVRWSDELTQNGNWVFVCDPEEVFIEDPLNQPIYLLSNDNYTEDGRLVVTVFDAETNQAIRTVFYSNTDKKLARYAVDLWRNTVTPGGGISPSAAKDANWTTGLTFGSFAVIKGSYTVLYTDPTNVDGRLLSLAGGSLVGVVPSRFIQTEKGRFYFVSQSPQGKGWVLEDTFDLATITSLWKLGCGICSGGGFSPNTPC